jgi:hypothetical protein
MVAISPTYVTDSADFMNFFSSSAVCFPFRGLQVSSSDRPRSSKEIIEEQIGRKITCECEIFSDSKEIKRKRLQAAFGVDFGEPGKRNLDVV